MTSWHHFRGLLLYFSPWLILKAWPWAGLYFKDDMIIYYLWLITHVHNKSQVTLSYVKTLEINTYLRLRTDSGSLVFCIQFYRNHWWGMGMAALFIFPVPLVGGKWKRRDHWLHWESFCGYHKRDEAWRNLTLESEVWTAPQVPSLSPGVFSLVIMFCTEGIRAPPGLCCGFSCFPQTFSVCVFYSCSHAVRIVYATRSALAASFHSVIHFRSLGFPAMVCFWFSGISGFSLMS